MAAQIEPERHDNATRQESHRGARAVALAAGAAGNAHRRAARSARSLMPVHIGNNVNSVGNIAEGTFAPIGDALPDDLAGRRAAFRLVLGRTAIGLGSLVALVLLWWGIAVVGNYPAYILPTPLAVGERTWAMLLDGSLPMHFGTTVLEAGLGFLLALVVGVGLGYPIARSRAVERLVSPYIAVSQGLPVVALAPLLVLWVADDLARKVVIVALIVFFPILVNTIVAIRGIDRSMLEVARISGATPLQTIRYVELPLGLRPLLGGIKLGLTLSITGAVVGEFVSSGAGLGFLLMLGRGLFDTTLIFVGLVALAALTLVCYLGVSLLEKALITWE